MKTDENIPLIQGTLRNLRQGQITVMTDRTTGTFNEDVTTACNAGNVCVGADVTTLAKSLYKASIAERVELIRQGVLAARVNELADALCVTRDHLSDILNLPRTSVRRKIRQGTRLSTVQSERVLGLVRLIGQVAVMVEHSGDPKGFDVARWVGEWLEQPAPALGGSRPADYMDTLTGQELVFSLILQSQVGVFA